MRIHEEYERSISAFTHQLERLKYELEYFRSEDRHGIWDFLIFIK